MPKFKKSAEGISVEEAKALEVVEPEVDQEAVEAAFVDNGKSLNSDQLEKACELIKDMFTGEMNFVVDSFKTKGDSCTVGLVNSAFSLVVTIHNTQDFGF